MISLRYAAVAVILTGTVASGLALAQTTALAAPTATDSKSASKATQSKTKDSKSGASTAVQVQDWTRKQWNAMTKEWSKDKAKWADCRKRSSDQKLSGRKSSSYLYACMKA
jgi:hypothetical protein